MPFRARIKRALRRSSSSASSSRRSSDGELHSWYRPGERLPPPRFKKTPCQKHMAVLESFTFADYDALDHDGDGARKPSADSRVSPGGSRLSSRRGSWEHDPGVAGAGAGAGWRRHQQQQQRGAHADGERSGLNVEVLVEGGGEEEGDSAEDTHVDTPEDADIPRDPKLVRSLTAQDHLPFTVLDVENALKKSQSGTTVAVAA